MFQTTMTLGFPTWQNLVGPWAPGLRLALRLRLPFRPGSGFPRGIPPSGGWSELANWTIDFHIFQRGRYTTNQTKSEFQAWTGSIRCQIRNTSTRIGSRWWLIFWMVNRLAYSVGGAYLARLVATRLRMVLWLYWCIFWGWPTRDSGGTI